MRLGSSISTSGERCAYFDGSAYLLGLRFFCSLGEDSGTSWVVVASRVRLIDRTGDAGAGALFGVVLVVAAYWYFANVPLKDADCGASDRSSLLGTSCASPVELSGFAGRVRGIFGFQLRHKQTRESLRERLLYLRVL
jgi:hypothetical protein